MLPPEVSLLIFQAFPLDRITRMIRNQVRQGRYELTEYPINEYSGRGGLETLPFLPDLANFWVKDYRTILGRMLQIKDPLRSYPKIIIFEYNEGKAQMIIHTQNYPSQQEMYVVAAIQEVPFRYYYSRRNHLESTWNRDFEGNRWLRIENHRHL